MIDYDTKGLVCLDILKFLLNYAKEHKDVGTYTGQAALIATIMFMKAVNDPGDPQSIPYSTLKDLMTSYIEDHFDSMSVSRVQ